MQEFGAPVVFLYVGQVLVLPALGDRMYLTQLVMNVVENAVLRNWVSGGRIPPGAPLFAGGR